MSASTDMNWYGWGDPEAVTPLPPAARDLLAAAFGGTSADTPPPPSEAAVKLSESTLTPEVEVELSEIVGADHVLTNKSDRLLRSGGKSTVDLFRRRSGEALSAPDAVVLPADHDEVVAVLECCVRYGIAVVPFGGGTSVVGGLESRPDGDAPFESVISVDLRRLDQLIELDTRSRSATVGAGLRAKAAEEVFSKYGYTLGHFPQSFEYATIGGFAATRSSGQASSGYGSFADLVLALRVATPTGTVHVGRAPASAAGPDLRHLFLGSEGTLGVITEVTVRLRSRPDVIVDEAWSFPDLAAGTEAVRALTAAGTLPAIARLSDETETAVNRMLAGESADAGGCLLFTGYEGADTRVRTDRSIVRGILDECGGNPLPPEAAAGWRPGRYRAPYLRDTLLAAGVWVETLETAAYWSRLPAVYEAVRAALNKSSPSTPLVMCHISHLYEGGASLYFTVLYGLAAAEDDQEAAWLTAKRAVGDAIIAAGGTITHHHAVGLDHRDWMNAEVGETGVDILRAVKDRLDPAGILNPGKLIPASPPSPAVRTR